MKDYSILDELVPKTVELHRTIFDKGYEQGMNDARGQQKKEQRKCELANCICPYKFDCDVCEVFCVVERTRQRAKEKE